jgi:hypothetical protein
MRSNSTDTKDIRRFGVFACILSGCLCTFGIWKEKPIPTYFFALLFFTGTAFILAPSPSKPVYELWMKITHLVGRIFTIMILVLSYYLVITPTALIRKIFTESSLPMRPDKRAFSYWVERNEPAQPKERFHKRY